MFILHVVYQSAASSDASTAYVMEGISLFGVIPRLSAVPAGGFIISASCLSGEAPLIAGSRIANEVPMPEGVHAQGFIESESAVDLRVIQGTSGNVDSAVDHGTQAGGTSASTADVPADNEHLDNIGEFEFLTPCILLVIACCIYIYIYILDLVMPHQLFRGLDHIV